MQVISEKKLRQFWAAHPDAEMPLRSWVTKVEGSSWKNFAEVRADYSHADQYERCTIFNIGGNKYRLITAIHYNRQKVFVRFILTHAEYDAEKWKPDCMLTATKTYLELVKKVPLRPIQSEKELDRAIAAIDMLLARPTLSRDEDDYLDVLSDLVHKYERATHPVLPLPDREILIHLMEGRSLSRAELHRQTGIPSATIAAVLGGKRSLSREQVSTLSRFFNVSSNAFALSTESESGSDRARANGQGVAHAAGKKKERRGRLHGSK